MYLEKEYEVVKTSHLVTVIRETGISRMPMILFKVVFVFTFNKGF